MRGIIVSNGLNRFPLADAAAEFAQIGQLNGLLVGGYPNAAILRLELLGRRSERFVRALARKQPIPDALVKSYWGPEILGQAASGLGHLNLESLSGLLYTAAFRTFSWHSKRSVRRDRDSAIFLYRSGFGLSAVSEARRRGMLAVAYHSTQHPNVLWRLLGRDEDPLPRLWRLVLADLRLADAVVVEGDFLKASFLDEGWPASRLRAVYQGVDERFLEQVPQRLPAPPGAPLRLLFVGRFGRPKGAEAIVLALDGLTDVDWRLTIAGSIDRKSRLRFGHFLSRSNVDAIGTVSRGEVATRMTSADVFVFPSLVEGSARVVFEALASGCYVITTPNSGSIVKDGVHGALVPIHAPEELAAAIRHAASDRAMISVIGDANAQLVRREYRQSQFARALLDVLCELYAARECPE